MLTKNQTDEQLLKGIQESNNTAFRELFNRYYKMLLSVAINILQDINSAKDVVQEVFFQLWKKREQLIIHSTLIGYLKKAVINRSLNLIKSRKKTIGTEPLEQMQSTAPSANEKLEADDLEIVVKNALQSLPERCRLVFIMRRIEGLSHKEIAEKLDISTKTIENQMTKALKVLKDAVQPFIKKE